ncbi:hypothetical protein [Verrucomicrobium spinosum]|uniref:hypothetical protein n=1 Tax=Verrucomicrobium spinosum TaxID=2736 RepID=UPI0001744C37|nr:hypothetical protein [Verrucomicrobium spinosum]
MRFSPVLLSIALLALACCTRMPPDAPGSGMYSGQGEAAYRGGYHHGFQDGRRGRDSDYERYYYEYNPRTEKPFEKGYDLGYEAGEDQAEAREVDRDAARNHGYDAGHTDSENGQPPYYQRHRHAYTLDTEPTFAKGYEKGYREGRSALRGE